MEYKYGINFEHNLKPWNQLIFPMREGSIAAEDNAYVYVPPVGVEFNTSNGFTVIDGKWPCWDSSNKNWVLITDNRKRKYVDGIIEFEPRIVWHIVEGSAEIFQMDDIGIELPEGWTSEKPDTVKEKNIEAQAELDRVTRFHKTKPVPFEFPSGTLEKNGAATTEPVVFSFPADEATRNKLQLEIIQYLTRNPARSNKRFIVDGETTAIFDLVLAESLWFKIIDIDGECDEIWQQFSQLLKAKVDSSSTTDTDKIKYIQSLIDSGFAANWPE